MISGLPTSKFLQQFERQCTRAGGTLLLVNPAYSSVGGYTKYGLINGLPVDTAAALWIGRQGVLGVKPLLEKMQNPTAQTEYPKRVPQMLMVKKQEEACVFPLLYWAHHRNMPGIQKLQWKTVSSKLEVKRPEWKKHLTQ